MLLAVSPEDDELDLDEEEEEVVEWRKSDRCGCESWDREVENFEWKVLQKLLQYKASFDLDVSAIIPVALES